MKLSRRARPIHSVPSKPHRHSAPALSRRIKSHRGKRGLILLVLIILLAISILGGVVVYRSRQSQQSLAAAFGRLLQDEQQPFQLNSKLLVAGRVGGQLARLEFTLVGQLPGGVIGSKVNQQISGSGTLSLAGKSMPVELQVVHTTDKSWYIKVKNLPIILQTVAVNQNTIEATAGATFLEATAQKYATTFMQIEPDMVDKILAGQNFLSCLRAIDKWSSITAGAHEQLAASYKKYPFIQTENKSISSVLSNATDQHYKLAINEPNLAKFWQALPVGSDFKADTGCRANSTKQPSNLQIDAWLDTNASRFTKIIFNQTKAGDQFRLEAALSYPDSLAKIELPQPSQPISQTQSELENLFGAPLRQFGRPSSN